MLTHPRQLPIPGPASDDPKAVEILRVWAAGGRQHVAIATGIWDDPANWGMMLVDLAKHIANAYEESGGQDRKSVLERIHYGSAAEWASPTDEPSGGLIDG